MRVPSASCEREVLARLPGASCWRGSHIQCVFRWLLLVYFDIKCFGNDVKRMHVILEK